MKQIILTGTQPTGTYHVGNYLGAIKPALETAGKTEYARCASSQSGGAATSVQSFFFIADYHALTTVKCAKTLQQNIKEAACTWLACGLDPKQTVFYRQSDIPEIFELATILSNYTAKGLLDRSHAFKDANQKAKVINVGLYTYPVLMTADILIMSGYRGHIERNEAKRCSEDISADIIVPVGQDQKQHVEIAADIAVAFNAVYECKALTIPSPQIEKSIATIPGLDGRKMSKSYGNTIPLFCDEAELLKCIKRITTDSSAPTDPKPKDHLIFQLYKHFAGAELENKIGWGEAKQKLFEAINNAIKPMRDKYNHYMNNYSEVEKILADGAKRAREVARKTLDRVRKAIGVN